MELCRAAGVLFALLFATANSVSAVTLIQRSNGLAVPLMEEGRSELELGDVNGDGYLDIVSVGDHGSPFVNSDEHGIMTWLGDGAGNWSVIQVGNFGYGGVALGDLDRDGFLDAAWGIHHDWASSGMGSTLIGAALGDGTGANWTSWADGLATTGEEWGMFATDLADFDADGRLDLISQSFGGSNGIRIYRNEGTGSWSPAYTLGGGNVAYTIETGDFDSDGFLDFGCTRTGGTVFLGDGQFGFTSMDTGLPAGTKSAIDIRDWDGDGFDDLLLAVSGSGVHACRFDPSGPAWIDASSGLPTTGSIDMVQLGDVDGDGIIDAVTFDAPIGRLYLGDGTGNWTADATWTMPSPGTASALRVDGDVDGDGREDIVVSARKSGFPFSRNQLRVYAAWEEPTEHSITMTMPNGEESYIRGSIREIRWAAAVPPEAGEATVDIRLSVDGENGPWASVATGLPNNGRYEWRVDAAGSSNDCRVEVELFTADGSVVARSSEPFTILDPTSSSVPPAHLDMAESGLLRVSSNPVVSEASFQWSPEAPDRGQLSIFATDGRRVDHLSVERRDGDSSVRWNRGPGLPSGVYFAVLEAGGWTGRTHLVLVSSDRGR